MASNGISAAVVAGNLTRDAELNQSGKVLQFGVAVNRYHKENGDEAHFFDVKVLGNRAEPLSKILTKGSKVTVLGDLVQERWETEDGQKRSVVRILAREVVLAGAPRDDAEPDREAETGGW